jgi:glycosyltransferase involved in cell wall biosynthesis
MLVLPSTDSRTARLRIALLLTSLGIGGAELQVVSLAERLEARGHAVLLVTLMNPLPEEWPTRLPVVRLGMRKTPAGVAAALARGVRVLREFKPDILHSHTKHANLAARFWRMSGTVPRVLSTLHNVREGGLLRMLIYRATDRYSAHTTAVSAAAAESYLRAGAVSRAKCSVLTNAIDTDRFKPDSERRVRQRAQLHAGDGFVWLAAGRAARSKDYPNLLRAFSHVVAQEPAAELWIAGEGTESLPRAKGVRTLGLVRDMTGLLDAADGFVMSSAWEGMPLALGEAMAMEKPVVATRVGGIEELAGNCAVLVAPANDEELAAAMLATMRCSQVDLAESGRRGRERIVAHFSWERKMQEWEALYATLVAQ